ncbi:UNC-like C-terminal-domain-containing protein [Kockovaella imperatae]|uniref:UNC-like C-terminal-domain-containing protein n=1 Tax=Kockovaella imperatae TaxID=4999 RepID=A0A1Y1URY8_9TREE|nr:UNC-like C-terminal-domain-containing protein [Kockovaella imperatae]ORX39945.1 UNC-like C-terminal-domain-containing protein [Kockovaella imperatae]
MGPKRSAPPTPNGSSMVSPARSTRSTSRSVRGAGDEDDWESQSVQSQTTNGAFKVPNARTGRTNRHLVGLKDTSVNIAAAFHAAQTGQIPTPTSERSFAPPPASKSKAASQRANNGRAKSPIEQVASSARALKPVRYFLRPPGEEGEEDDPSFESYRSTDTSYDYQQEEAYVRAAQQQQEAAKQGRRVNDGRKRHRGDEGDMPYRPGEDDWQGNSEDSGEEEGGGEGIVKNGGLEGRAETRGQRKERGEGYLGNGSGIQPRTRRSHHADEDDRVDDDYREQTPVNHFPLNHHGANRHLRSPTPVQALARAFSPHPRSPTPQFARRKRQPSSARTVVTNLLHGMVIALQTIVELVVSTLSLLLVHPLRSAAAMMKSVLRRAKEDWWKWLSAMLALSLALRMLNSPWWRGTTGVSPVPSGSLSELADRLHHLERAVSLLSDSANLLADAEHVGKEVDTSLIRRIAQLESTISSGQKDPLADAAIKHLKQCIFTLQTDLNDLSSRIGKTETHFKRLNSLETDVQALNARVDGVEKDVRSALDDGRLRKSLDRILPDFMPVKRNARGTVDIEPSFWVEMRKVLAGKSDVEEMIRKALKSGSNPSQPPRDPLARSDEDLDAWGEKLFQRKTAEGVMLSRSDFLSVLDTEIANLRHLIDNLPRQKQSVIQSSRGEDMTSVLQDLIDAALLKYSKDTLARPDFALFSAGGRIVPSITSDTLVMREPSTLGRWVMGQKAIEGRSPATALHPDTSVGSCWPFKGSQGQLGVLLNSRVVVTDLTVEHAASELALDITTAPKDVQVWGVVEGSENKAKVERYLESHPNSDFNTSDQILLGSFTYDPSSPSHIQTFPVEPAVVDLGIDVGIVIFRIQSNWGAEFTCLYRIRVHGEVAT